MKKDLLGIADLSVDEIYRVLDTAEAMREIGERPIKKVPTLRGKTVVNLFYEPSTRTRTSFEIAEKRLSADTLNIAVRLERAEGRDARGYGDNIEAMAPDMIVLGMPRPARAICSADLPFANHQRRRRDARTSDAGAARCFTIRQHKQRSTASRHRRRPAAQPGAAVEGSAPDQARRRSVGVRPPTLVPPGSNASACACRRRSTKRSPTRRHHDAAHSAGAHAGRLLPVAARVLQRLRDDCRTCRARQPDVIIMHPGR